jgi:thiosulfate/3-mercaptopyruvate sulfurtransferase
MATAFTTLIEARELASHLGDAQWIVFDCRHDLADTEAGRRAWHESHIPGARFAHLDENLAGPRTGTNGRHPLPDPQTFCDWLGASGMDRSKQAVACDDAGGIFAARLWWMLRWLGHDAVAVLDGGLQAWRAAGLPLTAETSRVVPAHFAAAPPLTPVDAGWIASHLQQPQTHIIDARSPDRYRGENETLDPVGGHIPGALNRFFKRNLDESGHFKRAGELRAEFSELLNGAAPQTVVHQCGSGVTACHNLLAMEIAGLHGSRLYPGSWSEWCSDPRRPVARGQGSGIGD